MADKNKCTRCGLCCTCLDIEGITEDDLIREPLLEREAQPWNFDPDPRAPYQVYFGKEYSLPTPCPFIRFGAGRTACSIYAHRPTICRRIRPGGTQCLKLRAGAAQADSVMQSAV